MIRHGNTIDLTGHTYNLLTAIEIVGTSGGSKLWRCRCVCGAIVEARANDMRAGKHKSCGCRGKGRSLMGSVNWRAARREKVECGFLGEEC